MKSLLLTLSIICLLPFTASLSYGADCKGKVVNTNLGSLSWNSPTIDLNGSLRIFVGTKEAEVVDVFTSDHDAFTGFNISNERVDDKDLRNAFVRWVFPKDLKPSEYYIIFSLNDSGMEYVKSKKATQITLSLRQAGQTRNATVNVSSSPSWNCK